MSHLQNPHAAAPISGNNYQDNASTLYPNSDAAPISSNNYNQQSRTDYYHQNGDGNGSVDVNGAPLEQTQSSLSISPALFEKLYLSPQNAVKGDLRKTFGNPTPLALVGFTVALAPISIQLMGWRGAMGQTATVGATYFFGGMLLMISGLLEFFLGNTFPCVVFFGYGGHFLTFGSTFQPFYNAVAAYTPNGTQELTPAFASSFAFYTIFMSVLSFIYLVCSLRTNLIFVGIFAAATTGFALAAAGFWTTAAGMAGAAGKCLVGAGASFFTAVVLGWYLLAVIMFAEVGYAFSLPVVDLSTRFRGGSEREAAKRE